MRREEGNGSRGPARSALPAVEAHQRCDERAGPVTESVGDRLDALTGQFRNRLIAAQCHRDRGAGVAGDTCDFLHRRSDLHASRTLPERIGLSA